MKRNIIAAALTFAAMLVLGACDKVTEVEEVAIHAPEILSFEPTSGKVGTEITIIGNNLGTVNAVTIGGGSADIKYRINATTLVAKVSATSRSGKITVANNAGESTTDAAFTVVYMTPAITDAPASAAIGDDILLSGSDLETVTAVGFGPDAIPGNVKFQSEKEILVTVPFVETDDVITLTYNGENGPATVKSASVLAIDRPQPSIDPLTITSVNEGETIRLTGENMHLIERVTLGDIEVNLFAQSETGLSFYAPEVNETQTYTVTAWYYNTASIVVSTNLTVVNVKLLHYVGMQLGCRESGINSFFNATNGETYNADDVAGTIASNTSVYFYTDWSSNTVTIGNPANAANKMKNFKTSGGVALEAANFPNVVKFVVCNDTELADAVRAGTLTEIPDDVVTRVGKPGTSDFRFSQHYQEGDVALFALFAADGTTPAEFGFIYIKAVNSNEKKSTITFDCYYQKP